MQVRLHGIAHRRDEADIAGGHAAGSCVHRGELQDVGKLRPRRDMQSGDLGAARKRRSARVAESVRLDHRGAQPQRRKRARHCGAGGQSKVPLVLMPAPFLISMLTSPPMLISMLISMLTFQPMFISMFISVHTSHWG